MSETERIARAYREMEARAGSRWSLDNPGNQAILEGRRRAFRGLLERAGWLPLGSRRVLEVGSGTGSELAWMVQLGASPTALVGVDLLPDRVATARANYPELDFRQGNAEHLEFEDATFDLVAAITVFSSILQEAMAENVASEIVRVLKPGGYMLWYDTRYDSTSNPNVKGVTSRRVRELFPALRGDLETITVAPPLARRLGPLTPALYPLLSLATPLRSHLVGLLRAL